MRSAENRSSVVKFSNPVEFTVNNKPRLVLRRRARLALSAAVLASAPFFFANHAAASNFTWDASASGAGATDGSNTWDNVTQDWYNGSLTNWTNANTSIAIIGNGGTAGTISIGATSISANGLTFNTGVTGNYLINSTGAGTLTLQGASGAGFVTVGAGLDPTISAIIAGASGITVNGGGTLTLAGANTYTGGNGTSTFSTNLNGTSTLVVNSGGTLGASNASLDIGGDQTGGNTLTINASTTMGGIYNTSNTATADTLNIASGQTLTSNGGWSVGFLPATTGTATTSTLNTTGNGALAINTGTNNFVVGIAGNNNSGTLTGTLNASSLSSFTVVSTGTGASFLVGSGTRSQGVLTLSNTANTITANSITVGTSNGGNAGSTSTINLEAGTNTFQTASLIVSSGKNGGQIVFPTGVHGNITITGETGGASTANITIGTANSATYSGNNSRMLLAGGTVNIQAGTVIVSNVAGASGGNDSASLTFDNGTFNATNLNLGVYSSATSYTGTAVGNFVMGNTTGSSPTLNITSGFLMLDRTDATAGATGTVTGNFTLLSGTANIGSNITATGTTTAVSTANFTLSGGILNMEGNAVNLTGTDITSSFNMPGTGKSASIQSLGGAGITTATAGVSGTPGLNVNGGGSLTLIGTNSYTGATVVSNGSTLQVGNATTATTLSATPSIDLSGTNLIFAPEAATTITYAGQITDSGNVTQNGSGTTVISGSTNNYSGNTNVTAGTLNVTGQLYFGVGSPGTAGVSGSGTLGGSGTLNNAGIVVGSGGTVYPGLAGTTLTAGSVTSSGGTLTFDVGTSGASVLNLTGGAALNSGTITFTLSGTPTAGSIFNILDSTGLSNSETFTATNIGRTTLTPSVNSGNSNDLVVTVGGGPANLIWVGSNADGGGGGIWDSAVTQNWTNTSNANAFDVFYPDDIVTFNDSASNFTVDINSGNVSPGATVSFANSSAHAYTVNGTNGITGVSTALSLTGTGTVTFNNVNTYGGATTISGGGMLVLANSTSSPTYTVSNGTLQLAGNSVISGASVSLGNGSTTGSLDLDGHANTIVGLTGVLNTAVITNSNASLGTLTYAGASTLYGGSLADGTGKIALTVGGPGTLTLGGTVNYSGNTTVSGGALVITGTAANIGSANLITSGTGKFTDASDTTINSAVNVTNGGTITLNNAAQTVATLNGGGTLVLNNATALTVSGGGSYAGAINDGTTPGGSLTVSGGTLSLLGSNGYTGVTNIGAGAMVIVGTSSNALGLVGTTNTAGANVNIADGGTLNLGTTAATNGLDFFAKTFFIGGTGVGGLGAIYNPGGVQMENAFQRIQLTDNATVNPAGNRIDVGRNNSANFVDLHGFTLTKIGAQQFTLTGNATTAPHLESLGGNPGTIVVSAGTLSIEEGTTSDANVTIEYLDGSTAGFYDTTGVLNHLTILGNGITTTSGVTLSSEDAVTNATYGGNIVMEDNVIASYATTNAGNLVLTGVISDNGTPYTFTKNNSSTPYTAIALAGNNTYSGATIINAGGLILGNGGSTGTLGSGYTGNIVDNGSLIFFRSDTGLTFINTVSGTGSIDQIGIGTSTLTATNSSYTGQTAVASGTLNVANLTMGGTNSSIGAASNAAANILLNNSGTLQYTGSASITTDHLFSVGAGGGSIDSSGAGTLQFTNSGAIVSEDPASRVVVLSSGDTVVKLYPSSTQLNNMDLTVGMAVSGLDIQAGTTITAVSPSHDTISISGTATGSTTTALTFTDTALPPRILTLTGSNTGNNLLAGSLSDGASKLGLNKNGAGTWILSSTANTYTGPTNILQGTLASGAINALPTGTTLTLGSSGNNGTFDLRGNNQTLSAGNLLVGSGGTATVTDSTGHGNLNLSGGAGTFGGAITGGVALNVQNFANLNLSGGSNTWSGGTTIDNTSTLNASASGALPNSQPILNNGALQVSQTSTNTVGQITGTGSLTVGDGISAATLQLAPGSGASTVNSLAVGAGSNLDLTSNGIIINYGSAGNQGTTDTTILSYLSGASYSQAPQTGAGIVSSSLATNTRYAIGEVDGNDGVSGSPVAANTLEVAYTLQGDLNLDDIVNGTDFSILVTHFGQPLTGIGWEQGDINGDGIVNGTDFSALVTNFGAFNNSTAGLSNSTGGGLVTVPEPATTGLLVLGGLGLLSRRKRRSIAR